MSRMLLGIILILLSNSVLACGKFSEDTVENLMKNVRSSMVRANDASMTNIGTMPYICKVWDAYPDLSIIVIPYANYVIREPYPRYFGFIVSVVDEERNLVIDSIDESDLFDVEVLELSGVTIDATDYQIDDSAHAFGVRYSRKNKSESQPFREEWMRLYVLSRIELKMIAGPILMSLYEQNGNGKCGFYGKEVKTLMEWDRIRSDGHGKLVANVDARYFDSDAASCNRTSSEWKTDRYDLEFDGDAFVIPRPLRDPLKGTNPDWIGRRAVPGRPSFSFE
jgi:hypothetical protein